ncbi:hypothetical protein [Xenorhabdus innexi]|uniref:Uncharacterized protein n=1 Tax=Xenorhabdus innexi TaxID=290109 RepID=A0A1N6N1Q4_9GAMM|nr:hypothetical protein [Xenorhabdus innexi]PHM29096.1 hypothetical protein Xinn_03715 [Xenorhabdus innexi]SIP74964.1 hypothetical protein XIS1_90004 [Xenorhabdus innexi]
MSTEKKLMSPPILPQRDSNGIIYIYDVFHDVFQIEVNRYNSVHVLDQIVVHVGTYINSFPPYTIDIQDVHLPRYLITIPFSAINSGKYDVFYTVTNFAGNKANSESVSVQFVRTNQSHPQYTANLTAVGYQSIGDAYEILTIQMNDSKTLELIKNTPFYCEITPNNSSVSKITEIGENPDTIQNTVTNEYGQLKINLQGQSGDSCTIKVAAEDYTGIINHTIGTI